MENNRLAQLASAVSLTSEVAQQTELKNPLTDVLKTAPESIPEMSQFKTPEPTQVFPSVEPVPSRNEIIEDPEEEYDPEKEARSLVHTMHAIDQFALNIAVLVKSNISAGGSKALAKMKEALTKEFSGEELTPADTKLIARFKEYKSNMALLSGEMVMKPDELARLIEVATDYCAETRIRVGSGTAFWTNYLGNLAGRITKIMMK